MAIKSENPLNSIDPKNDRQDDEIDSELYLKNVGYESAKALADKENVDNDEDKTDDSEDFEIYQKTVGMEAAQALKNNEISIEQAKEAVIESGATGKDVSDLDSIKEKIKKDISELVDKTNDEIKSLSIYDQYDSKTNIPSDQIQEVGPEAIDQDDNLHEPIAENPELAEDGEQEPEELDPEKDLIYEKDENQAPADMEKGKGESLRYLANFSAMKKQRPNWSDDKIHRYIRMAEAENIEKDHGREIGELVELLGKEKGKEEKEKLIGELAGKMGINPKDREGLDKVSKLAGLETILSRQEENLRQMAKGNIFAREGGKWGRIRKAAAKTALYGGAGVGIAVATGGFGLLAGSGAWLAGGLGTARVIDRFVTTRKEDEKLEQEMKSLKEKLKDDEGLKKAIFNNIIAEIAASRQQKIDDKPKNQGPKPDNGIEPVQERLEYARQLMEQNKNFAGWTPEEKEAQVKCVSALLEIDAKNQALEQKAADKKPGAIKKIFKGLSKGFDWLDKKAGGETSAEKTASAAVFASMAVAAREMSIIRNILGAYSGLKVGDLAGNWLASDKREELHALRPVRPEDLAAADPENAKKTVAKARAQLADPEFQRNNPTDYAKLKIALDRREQADIRKAANLTDLIADRSSSMDKALQDRNMARAKQRNSKALIKVIGAASGAIAPSLLADYLQSNSAAKAPQAPSMPDAGSPVKGPGVPSAADDISRMTPREETRHWAYQPPDPEGRFGPPADFPAADNINQLTEKEFPRELELYPDAAGQQGPNLAEENLKGANYQKVAHEVKIGGKINTASAAAYESLKQADPNVQDNFIRCQLGDQVEINDQNRSELVGKAVRRYSVSPEAQHLVHNGETARLYEDGSFRVNVQGDQEMINEYNERHMAEVKRMEELKTSIPERVGEMEKAVDPEGIDFEIGKHVSVIETNDRQIADALHREIGDNTHVSPEMVKAAGLQKFTSIDKELLRIWSDRPDYKPEDMQAMQILHNHGWKVDSVAFKQLYDNMPKQLSSDIQKTVGYFQIFTNHDDNMVAVGFKNLFRMDDVPSQQDFTWDTKNGHYVLKDAFGHKGFDIIMSKDKLGIDGPAKFNWGVSGWLGNIKPEEALTPTNIDKAKSEIERLARAFNSEAGPSRAEAA